MPFFAKMTKTPLVSPRLIKGGPNFRKSKIFTVLLQTRASRGFLATLTKFDLKLTLGGLKNPNFDPVVETG